MSIIGSNIKRLREEQQLSQAATGRAIGHSGGKYISAIERGQKHPSPEMLTRIAAALGTTPGDLKRPHDPPAGQRLRSCP